ncbi:MAG: sugar kinase [Bacillota bacterium]|nr:sugar kinase [Bacillota bacterium]
MMKRVVTFGEIMMRLSPPGYKRFVQTDSFDLVFGGGEANIAVSLAGFGVPAEFVTKLPDNELGEAAVRSLRARNVAVDNISRGGDRIGVYFLEKGASQRPSKVVYDRANSAVAMSRAEDYDWEQIFKDAGWFHFTGITPALGDNVAEICRTACEEAKKAGLTISCDLNFRKKLWTSEKAGKVMGELMKYVDVCIANEEDADKVFGIRADNTEVSEGRLDQSGYIQVARELTERFGFTTVAITLRESINASINRWGAMIYSDQDAYFSKKYQINIVDRVGGGDSFGAGLIYGLQAQKTREEALEFAVAASCLKHTIEGDFNEVTVSEVETLAAGDGSGRVQR